MKAGYLKPRAEEERRIAAEEKKKQDELKRIERELAEGTAVSESNRFVLPRFSETSIWCPKCTHSRGDGLLLSLLAQWVVLEGGHGDTASGRPRRLAVWKYRLVRSPSERPQNQTHLPFLPWQLPGGAGRVREFKWGVLLVGTRTSWFHTENLKWSFWTA